MDHSARIAESLAYMNDELREINLFLREFMDFIRAIKEEEDNRD